LRKKHKDSVNLRNHSHVIINSNEAWCCPSDIDDRNFARFDVPGRNRSPEHWRDLHNRLETTTEINAFLYYLLKDSEVTAAMDKYDSRTLPAILQADGLSDKLISLQSSPVHNFMYQQLRLTKPFASCRDHRPETSNDVALAYDDLLQEFNGWCERQPVRHSRYTCSSVPLFVKQLQRLFPVADERWTYEYRRHGKSSTGARCFSTKLPPKGKRKRGEGSTDCAAMALLREGLAKAFKTEVSILFQHCDACVVTERKGETPDYLPDDFAKAQPAIPIATSVTAVSTEQQQ
jgi:hypothetical protein